MGPAPHDVDEGALELPFARRSAVVARTLVAELGRAHRATPETVHDLAIVAHELVANAVDHGGPGDAATLRVSWRIDGETFRLAARDCGTTGDVAVRALPNDTSRGRGLLMIEAISEAWGVDRDEERTEVWARLRLDRTDDEPDRSEPPVQPDDLFAGAGSLRPLYESLDWSATSFGAPETWSPTLRATVRIILSTRFGCTLLWGPDHALLYNEAYVEAIGDKHPRALGAAARDIFPEAWSVIEPLLEQVTTRREPTWIDQAWVPLDRGGFLEDCWFTFSYSPVVNDDGELEGVLDITTEVTSEVVARRRLQTLVQLRGSLGDAAADAEARTDGTLREVHAALLDRAATALHQHPDDLPRVALRARLSDSAPAGDGLPSRPQGHLGTGVDLLVETVGDTQVAWLPLPTARTYDDPAVLVTTLSRSVAVDAAYRDFLRLVGGSVRQALDRAENLYAERSAALSDRQFSRALQRSLLGATAPHAGVELAGRYAPATLVDAIGGDWHDSFVDREGDLVLVVGDVAGHDRVAALAMGQARSLLRGTVLALRTPVGDSLTVFDETLGSLDLGVHLTVVVARLHRDPATGAWELEWAVGGHPPPVLVTPHDGARLLRGGHGPMMGLDLADERESARCVLPAGSTLVLYTDGLVERAGEHLDTSLETLLDVTTAAVGTSCDDLADHLLDHAGEHRDDVALLVVRV